MSFSSSYIHFSTQSANVSYAIPRIAMVNLKKEVPQTFEQEGTGA